MKSAVLTPIAVSLIYLNLTGCSIDDPEVRPVTSQTASQDTTSSLSNDISSSSLNSDNQTSSNSSTTSNTASSDAGTPLSYIQSITPSDNSQNIALNSKVVVVFTEPVLENSYQGDLITLLKGNEQVAGRVSTRDNQTFTFQANTSLSAQSLHTVKIAESMLSSGQTVGSVQTRFMSVADSGQTSQEVIDECMGELDIEMLAQVNAARAQARVCGSTNQPAVPPLKWSCKLQQAALKHSQDMGQNNFFNHTGSNGSTVSSRIDGANYAWRTIGENIAAGQPDVSSAMRGWLKSPGHCRNIMSEGFTEFGMGHVTAPQTQYRTYWTQNFARPR